MLTEESGKGKRTGKMKQFSSCFDSNSRVFQHILLNLLGSEMLKSLYRRSIEEIHTETVQGSCTDSKLFTGIIQME